MNFAFVYLFRRIFFRIGAFFVHWYADGTRAFLYKFLDICASLDSVFAVGLTLKYFFHPLYKDYTPIGLLFGPIFRTGRALLGSALYMMVTVVFLFAYIVWVAVPLVIIAKAFGFLS